MSLLVLYRWSVSSISLRIPTDDEFSSIFCYLLLKAGFILARWKSTVLRLKVTYCKLGKLLWNLEVIGLPFWFCWNRSIKCRKKFFLRGKSGRGRDMIKNQTVGNICAWNGMTWFYLVILGTTYEVRKSFQLFWMNEKMK